jgi:hypothetical protein
VTTPGTAFNSANQARRTGVPGRMIWRPRIEHMRQPTPLLQEGKLPAVPLVRR